MTPEGPFLKLEGIITKDPVETMVIEGFKHHENFPKCCAYHIKMDEHITDWWNKFPNCCDTHRYFSKKENFSKNDYQYVIKKILDSIAFIEFHVSQVIDDDDWFSDIIHYITYVKYTFGSPGIGSDKLGTLIDYFLSNYTSDNMVHIHHKWEFPEDRRLKLLEHFNELKNNNKTKNRDIDLNLLYRIYQKWLKTVPDFYTFSVLKEKTSGKAPLDLFMYKLDYNPYLRMTSSEVLTKVELIQALINLTKNVLSQINTPQMLKDRIITNAQSFKIDLINDSHRLKQLKLVEEYDKSESKYLKIIKTWLSNEKKYFEKIIPELNKLPPAVASKNYLKYNSQSTPSDLKLIDNSTNMTLKILNDICYGSLKPWSIDFSNKNKLSHIVREVSKLSNSTTQDLYDKLKILLTDFSDYKSIIEASPSSINIIPLPFTYDRENPPNLESKFYIDLIDIESIRYYNEVLSNPLIKDLNLDTEYQIGRKVLDALKTLIIEAKQIIQNQQSLQNTKDADDLTLFVIIHLYKTLFALYFSIQKQYATYLKDTFSDVSDFSLYVFNETNDEFTLIENDLVLTSQAESVKSFVQFGSLDKQVKKITFGFSGDVKELENKVKQLCVHIEFLNEGLTTQETFVNTFVSKDLATLTMPIHISCPTNLFPIIQEKLKMYAPNFKDAIIEKSKLFYSINGTQLTAQNISKSRKLGCQATELIAKVNKIFS